MLAATDRPEVDPARGQLLGEDRQGPGLVLELDNELPGHATLRAAASAGGEVRDSSGPGPARAASGAGGVQRVETAGRTETARR